MESKVQENQLQEKLGNQDIHCDAEQLFELISKALTDTKVNLLDESISTSKANEEMNGKNVDVNALKLLHKNGLIDTSLTKPSAKTFVRQTKSQFRLYDVPIGDKWNDYKMIGEKLKCMMIE